MVRVEIGRFATFQNNDPKSVTFMTFNVIFAVHKGNFKYQNHDLHKFANINNIKQGIDTKFEKVKRIMDQDHGMFLIYHAT